GRYRHLTVIAEACHAGTLGKFMSAPGALLMAGASPTEDSKAANFDEALESWLSNQFSFTLFDLLKRDRAMNLREAYQEVYTHVSGSHVRIYNAQNFGDSGTTAVGDLIRP